MSLLYSLLGFIFGVGIFICAYRDFDWYMRSALVPMPMGRVGARRFHMGLGLFLGFLLTVLPWMK